MVLNDVDVNRRKKKLFKKYYSEIFNFKDLYPHECKFRHFRVELFSNRRRRFERIKDVFYDQDALKKRLIKIIPKNAYFTPVKWLNPIYVGKKKGETDIMLSSPLYFDIDYKHLDPPTFENALITAKELCNYIKDEYGSMPDKVIFSGKQGFHVHHSKWDENEILKKSPEHRINDFIKERKKITEKLHKRNILIDPTVTPDPYRILKISHTLHGDTGLIASNVENLNTFNPIKDSVFFPMEIYTKIFSLDPSAYDI